MRLAVSITLFLLFQVAAALLFKWGSAGGGLHGRFVPADPADDGGLLRDGPVARPAERRVPDGCRDCAARAGQSQSFSFFRNASSRTRLRSLSADGRMFRMSLPSCSMLQPGHSRKEW